MAGCLSGERFFVVCTSSFSIVCKKCVVLLKYVKIRFELVLEVTLIVLLHVMVQNMSEVLCIPLSCLIPSLSPG
jgi:hypothetical protein